MSIMRACIQVVYIIGHNNIICSDLSVYILYVGRQCDAKSQCSVNMDRDMSNRIRNRLLLTQLLIIYYGFATFGRLIESPINQAQTQTVANVTMRCSSTLGSNSITWYLVPVGESVNLTIASGSVVYPAFTQLYWIDQPTANESNLIISSLNDSSAGTFTCADREMVAHAQLIVGHYLIQSISASNDLTVGDSIKYSCELVYLGNLFFPPIFYLQRFDQYYNIYNIDKTNSSEFGKLNSLNTATGFFYRTATCIYPQNLQCLQQFEPLIGNLLPGSATNIPYYRHSTNFPNAKVSCVPKITGAQSGAVLCFGSMITCYMYLNSTQPVNYTWTALTNGTVSIGPQLTILYGGSYECNASYDISGQWESVSTTIYNLTVKNLSITAKPLYGPIAGGTNITITLENWSTQIANISAVYLGGIVKTTSSQSDKSSVVITTPKAEILLVGEPLRITTELTPGPYNITTNFSFTYQGNPEISGISPSEFVFTGGTIVNVTGTQLSSVANPLIQVTLVVDRGREGNTTTEKSIEPCEVSAEDSRHMTCRMPSVNIPDDFRQVLDSQYNNRSKRDTNSMIRPRAQHPFLLSRRKRYANALSLIGPNGVDQLVIYLGFILDGYEKYDNINLALPETRILIYSSPEINFTKDILEFDPDRDESISIQGVHMTRGCRIVDYVVQVGADICENIDLTDNRLRCRPPKEQPQSSPNVSIHCDQLVGIYIHLGYKTYQYACMKYSTRRPLALIIGLAVGLSSLVVIILLIIAIVCCCKRSRNRRNKSTNKTSDRNTAAANEAYESPSDQVYANAVYSRPTVQSLYADDEQEPPSIQLYANASELKRIDRHA